MFFSVKSPHADYHVDSSMAETRPEAPFHMDELTIDTSLLAFCKLGNLTSVPALPGQGFIYWLVDIQGVFFKQNLLAVFFR